MAASPVSPAVNPLPLRDRVTFVRIELTAALTEGTPGCPRKRTSTTSTFPLGETREAELMTWLTADMWASLRAAARAATMALSDAVSDPPSDRTTTIWPDAPARLGKYLSSSFRARTDSSDEGRKPS